MTRPIALGEATLIPSVQTGDEMAGTVSHSQLNSFIGGTIKSSLPGKKIKTLFTDSAFYSPSHDGLTDFLRATSADFPSAAAFRDAAFDCDDFALALKGKYSLHTNDAGLLGTFALGVAWGYFWWSGHCCPVN